MQVQYNWPIGAVILVFVLALFGFLSIAYLVMGWFLDNEGTRREFRRGGRAFGEWFQDRSRLRKGPPTIMEQLDIKTKDDLLDFTKKMESQDMAEGSISQGVTEFMFRDEHGNFIKRTVKDVAHQGNTEPIRETAARAKAAEIAQEQKRAVHEATQAPVQQAVDTVELAHNITTELLDANGNTIAPNAGAYKKEPS
jgi:hypothetical protein